MRILFVHQNFPGQFKHLAPALARAGHDIRALGIDGAGLIDIPLLRYRPTRGTSREIHPWAQDFETKIIRGEACALAAAKLKVNGFSPDVIIANPGWGESLFLKDVWPQAKLMALLEFFYAARGLDSDFDPEFANPSLNVDARIRAKTANLLLTLEAMDCGVSSTHFQRDTMPKAYQDRIEVIFDGIDTAVVKPDAGTTFSVDGHSLRVGDEIVTFVNRNLEPMRGYHVFMRALPQILRERPQAVALIGGGNGVSYGAQAPEGKTWANIFLDEVRHEIDLSRVHFVGHLPYADYLKVLQVSRCHVYLTVPFVLGWSCIEAMSAGALVIGSATPPVQEVIAHDKNGLLVDFFGVQTLANTVADVLARPEHFDILRKAARQTVIERYDLNTVCLPRYMRYIATLAG